jgi:hypothetical protein
MLLAHRDRKTEDKHIACSPAATTSTYKAVLSRMVFIQLNFVAVLDTADLYELSGNGCS